MKKGIKNFIIDYFTNPFTVWGIFVIITSYLLTTPEIYEFREFIWINFLHIPILWMSLAYVICKIHAPFWDSFKILSKRKPGLTYFFILGLVLIIAGEYVFFHIGIMELIAQQHSETIIDQNKFNFNTRIAFIIIYFLMPIFTYLLLHGTKTEMMKRNLKVAKNLKNHPWGFFITMMMAFVFSSIYTIILNNHLILK